LITCEHLVTKSHCQTDDSVIKQFTASVHCISQQTKLKQSHYKPGYTKGSSMETRDNTMYSENVEVEIKQDVTQTTKTHKLKLRNSPNQLL